MDFLGLFLVALIILLVIIGVKGIYIVKQAETVIVERLGKFDRVLYPGLNYIIPVFEILSNPKL